MIPLSDGIPARRFPWVNVALILANFAVWIFYELPHLNSSVAHSSFYPCSVDGSCHAPLAWDVSWFTSTFMHGSWDHILGNMLFLAIFGKNVEDAFGHLRYLVFYLAGGFVAAMSQAIAAVLGAYFVLYPQSRILTLVVVFPVRIPAWFFLGGWFLYQLVEGNFGLFSASSGGVAFFAHVGGFLFGVGVARLLSHQPNPSLEEVPA
jgi:membrane associated rhomboid family serine protease